MPVRGNDSTYSPLHVCLAFEDARCVQVDEGLVRSDILQLLQDFWGLERYVTFNI